ncbi:MAG: polysaccharide lyase family 7 protein, partial [Campylobacterota bacterium]|nr:polysaccharide lyase family 7 protein [Campylobacterota bacterium]
KLSIYIMVLTLFFSGCDFHKPPEEVDLDLIYDEIPPYSEATSFAPYDYDTFRPVIDRSKLQLYYDGVAIDYGGFDNYKSSNFYVDSDENLHFTIDKVPETYKTRAELREGPDLYSWSTADLEGHYWVATLRCLKPAKGVSSYTWMQIHGTSDTYNYPIIRLLWEREKNDAYDHLWAVTILSDPYSNNIYEYTDLGPRPDGFFSAEVHVRNNIMDILINHTLIKTYNVTYWQEIQNYYKAGVYINRFGDGGEVSAIFKSLNFFDDPSNIVAAHH